MGRLLAALVGAEDRLIGIVVMRSADVCFTARFWGHSVAAKPGQFWVAATGWAPSQWFELTGILSRMDWIFETKPRKYRRPAEEADGGSNQARIAGIGGHLRKGC